MNILVADSDVTIINQMKNQLSNADLCVFGATNSSDALNILKSENIDICFLQFALEPYNANTVIQILREKNFPGSEPGIIVSTSNKLKTQEQSVLHDLGQILLVSKPINFLSIKGVIAKALKIQKRRLALQKIKASVITPLISAGRTSEASTLIQSHLLDTKQEDAILIALELYKEMGEWQMALKIAKKLHDQNPKNSKYLSEVGEALAGLNDYDSAIKYSEQANKIAPDNYRRIRNIADWYSEQGNEEESAAKYEHAIALRKEDEDLKFSIYEEILAAGKENIAISVCKRTAQNTEVTRHYNNAGIRYSKQGKYQEAIAEYKKGFELVTDRKSKRSLLYNMAISHLNLKNRKNYQLAKGLLKRALEIDPDFQKASEKLDETNKRLGITTKP